MKTIFILFISVVDAIMGHVVAFFKEITGRDNRRDHRGYQSFVEAVRTIALQVRLQLHEFLSGLQHSPTL